MMPECCLLICQPAEGRGMYCLFPSNLIDSIWKGYYNRIELKNQGVSHMLVALILNGFQLLLKGIVLIAVVVLLILLNTVFKKKDVK